MYTQTHSTTPTHTPIHPYTYTPIHTHTHEPPHPYTHTLIHLHLYTHTHPHPQHPYTPKTAYTHIHSNPNSTSPVVFDSLFILTHKLPHCVLGVQTLIHRSALRSHFDLLPSFRDTHDPRVLKRLFGTEASVWINDE